MSGGSYNYAFGYVNDFATELRKDTPERRAFAELLVKVAKAMHDIEWIDFCDYGKGAETVAILACLGRRDISDAALNQVEDALTKALEGVRAARQPPGAHPMTKAVNMTKKKQTIQPAYRVEIDISPCEFCGSTGTFHVVGPDGYGLGSSYVDEVDAENIADALNDAYQRGQMSVKRSSIKGQ